MRDEPDLVDAVIGQLVDVRLRSLELVEELSRVERLRRDPGLLRDRDTDERHLLFAIALDRVRLEVVGLRRLSQRCA